MSIRPLEIIAIDERPPPPGVLGWRIDYPDAGAAVEPAELRLAGWVVPERVPVAAIDLVVEERVVGRAEMGVERAGVAEAFDGPLAISSGFRVAGNMIALQANTEVELVLRAVLGDGSRSNVGSVRLRRGVGADLAAPKAPLVSVVIPCFNQGHYLGEAIESVLAQTHSELELIVVDDGSDDNSYEVAARYPGVRRLRQRNSGVAVARNRGLAESRGAYAVFLDADDRLLPSALEVGVRELLAKPEAAFAAGRPRDIGRNGDVVREAMQPLVTRDHYLKLLEECFIWSGSSVVYRREPFEAVGGFNERRVAADDYELYLKLARSYPVICHDAIVTEYRRHGSNTTRNAGLILSSQIQVLNGQRRQLRGGEERAARRIGIRNTRVKQGEALVERIANAWRRRERRAVLRGLRTLARWDPGAFLRYRRRGIGQPGGRFEHLEKEPGL
ncbi:MAG TPA: glycosyltransferase [Solirubrobacterales bacterium]|nr:glycosyltransferase [Solirubrobacterales bacterium]